MVIFFLSEYTVLPILVHWRVATLRGKIAYYESNMHKSISCKDLDVVKNIDQLSKCIHPYSTLDFQNFSREFTVRLRLC